MPNTATDSVSDGSSTIQSSFADPRKYTDTIRYGFHGVIERRTASGDSAALGAEPLPLRPVLDPPIVADSGRSSATYPESMYVELANSPQFLAEVDEEAIRRFDLMPIEHWMKDAFVLLKRGGGRTAPRREPPDRDEGCSRSSTAMRAHPPSSASRPVSA